MPSLIGLNIHPCMCGTPTSPIKKIKIKMTRKYGPVNARVHFFQKK